MSREALLYEFVIDTAIKNRVSLEALSPLPSFLVSFPSILSSLNMYCSLNHASYWCSSSLFDNEMELPLSIFRTNLERYSCTVSSWNLERNSVKCLETQFSFILNVL